MKKYRLFGKIPVFDVILIAVLAIAAVLLYNVFMSSKSGEVIVNSETKTVRYTVEFKNISNTISSLPQPGEKIFETEGNYEVGRVISAEEKPFINYSYNDETGEPVSTKYEDRRTISVVVEAKATVSDRATEINNVTIGLGRSKTFNMPSLCATGVIVNIEEV